MRWLGRSFEFVGKVGLFSLRVLVDLMRPPFELTQLSRQIAEVGNRSLTLITVSGFALGAVMTLHTRSTLVMFGATAMIPAVQSVGFFVEIGPLVAGLLLVSGTCWLWNRRRGPCEHEPPSRSTLSNPCRLTLSSFL